jgi:glutathione S-transferase
MSELILHHYDISPYAEKIRLIMGLKGLGWRSVHIPIVMPKPDLTALTGGYRLTPVLQIGSDIYCDTKLIARRLEKEKTSPTLYPKGFDAINRGLAHWGETLFMDIVTIGFGMGIFPSDFVADRQKMIPGGVNVELLKMLQPSKRSEVWAKLQLIERQLEDGRAYLLGDEISLADLSVYHPLWAMRSLNAGQDVLASLNRIPPWMDRIAAVGHGEPVEMDSGAAVDVARRSSPATAASVDAADPAGRRVGDRIQIFPEAYGRDPVAGELLYLDAEEIALRRTDERAGEVVVHFPREGCYTLAA